MLLRNAHSSCFHVQGQGLPYQLLDLTSQCKKCSYSLADMRWWIWLGILHILQQGVPPPKSRHWSTEGECCSSARDLREVGGSLLGVTEGAPSPLYFFYYIIISILDIDCFLYKNKILHIKVCKRMQSLSLPPNFFRSTYIGRARVKVRCHGKKGRGLGGLVEGNWISKVAVDHEYHCH